MNKEIKYPCNKCERQDACIRSGVAHLKCYKWRRWFHQQWSEIQDFFGINVSECHEKKESDDNAECPENA